MLSRIIFGLDRKPLLYINNIAPYVPSAHLGITIYGPIDFIYRIQNIFVVLAFS